MKIIKPSDTRWLAQEQCVKAVKAIDDLTWVWHGSHVTNVEYINSCRAKKLINEHLVCNCFMHFLQAMHDALLLIFKCSLYFNHFSVLFCSRKLILKCLITIHPWIAKPRE